MTSYVPQCYSRGPASPKILIVGEAPGEREVAARLPFVGASGHELDKMLRDARINPDDVRFTNVLPIRPDKNDFEKAFLFSSKKAAGSEGIYHNGVYCRPVVVEGIRELWNEIDACNPNIIVPVGNVATWAITGRWGITKWRRSEIGVEHNARTWKVVPTYHPAAVMRTWEYRPITVHDFRIVRRESESPDINRPDYDFLLRPNFHDVMDYIGDLLDRHQQSRLRLSVDIETRNRQIACIGLARSERHAICIPIQSVESPVGSYWTEEEELEIIWKLRPLLTTAHIIGQNFSYDNQYFARGYGFACNLVDDTMHMQHMAFPGLPKGLDFLSSMYCEHHVYWKDEGKHWDPRTTHEDQLWNYNCIDAVAAYESRSVLAQVLSDFKLLPQYRERILTQRNAFTMMLRGTRSDTTAKLQLSSDLDISLAHIRKWWDDVVGYDIFGKDKKHGKIPGVSSKKFKTFCYDVLKLPHKFAGSKGNKKLTANKEACQEWEETCDVIFRPLLAAVRHYRSMLVFKSTFADQELDYDRRWRCTNNAGLMVTFRWSTSEDAFGYGTNLQNIPKGDER